MTGVLNRTPDNQGWEVRHVQATLRGPLFQALELDPLQAKHINPLLTRPNITVDFEIIEDASQPQGDGRHPYKQYAKLKEFNNMFVTTKQGDITVHFTPLAEFDDPTYPSKLSSDDKLQIEIAEKCFTNHPNNEFLYYTDELRDAYKAGVVDGFKEAQEMNQSQHKKQDNV